MVFDEYSDSELVRARVKGKEKFMDANKLFFTLSDLRFATPDFIANYRAKRLKCSVIVDLCSGCGFQTIAFAKTCKKIISVEIDSRKIEYARKNADVYGLKNIEFILGDAVSVDVIKKISKADVVFCDPERLPSEEERKIENIKIVGEIIKKYSKITKNIAIEVPPQLTPDKIEFDCEREYISFNSELNRLTLYFGKLKKNNVSAVSLPSEERIFEGKKKRLDYSRALKYIYDVNKAVLKANLVEELAFNIEKDIFMLENRNCFQHPKNTPIFAIFKKIKKNLFLTSDNNISSVFLTGFLVLDNVNIRNVADSLKNNNAKSVILRGEIPEQDYWKLRNSFESGLTGSDVLYLFIFGDNALVCRKL